MFQYSPCPRIRALGFALVTACGADARCLVQELVALGALLDRKNEAGETALMLALMPKPPARFNAAAAMALLEAGCATDSVDNNGQTALMRCAAIGSIAAVKLLIEAGADATATANATTALHLAAEAASPGVLRLLLEAGADPNVPDGFYATPLMTLLLDQPRLDAAILPAVDELLAGGASVLIWDEDGDPVLHLAVLMGHTAPTVERIAVATRAQLLAETRVTGRICERDGQLVFVTAMWRRVGRKTGDTGDIRNTAGKTALVEALWRCAARPNAESLAVLRCLLRLCPGVRTAFVETFGDQSCRLARRGKPTVWEETRKTAQDVPPAALALVAPLRWKFGPKNAVFWPQQSRHRALVLLMCLKRWTTMPPPGPAMPPEMLLFILSAFAFSI